MPDEMFTPLVGDDWKPLQDAPDIPEGHTRLTSADKDGWPVYRDVPRDRVSEILDV